ncbi:hypothetical protein EDB81DRAFT_884173 [Dactylonectria macrodidyma]|uniref:MOSC domain-containing protein n=1 Tax=Dactylonectria macrodidyma TaxID=307937 RepID=A0A9P9J292_9HYPO|nr:hypothetical protein EDB81DRAFT_884173 [Dactylonectria macrodidyma]
MAAVSALCFALVSAIAYLFLSSATLHRGDKMKITQLYVYPVKGLRGCALKTAPIGPYGVVGDRTFCLQKVHRDGDGVRYETMLIGYNLQMALFVTSVDYDKGLASVEWKGRGTAFDVAMGITTPDTISFPLKPSTSGCEKLEVNLHTSKASAYDLGDDYSTWFADRLGCEVRLVFIGDGSRPVLGSIAPNSPGGLRRARLSHRVRSLFPFLAYPAERLAFNDIAHFLVVTEESNDQVSSRLEDQCQMDVTKFRPNIVVKGASGAFVEDYWGELAFDGGLKMALTANCYRCQSITVDYDTGATATDDRGMAWKKLNKDRRVDAGAKYSPVFGRYGYCFGSVADKKFRVGQGVAVAHVNAQRTVFDWPHLTTFGTTKK